MRSEISRVVRGVHWKLQFPNKSDGEGFVIYRTADVRRMLRMRDRVGCNRVAKRVAKREVTAKRPVFRREDDWGPVLDKMVMQRVGVIAAEPDRDAPTEPVRFL